MIKEYKKTFIVLSELETLPFLNMMTLKRFFPHIKEFSLYQKIKRWIDRGKILELKNGLHVTNVYFNTHKSNIDFIHFVANNLCFPSYVSGAYMLQYYDMLTDITNTITSVTLKSSRVYNNKIGDFIYYSINENLYNGYISKQYGKEKVYIASKAKALFDFLYFKYYNSKDLPLDLKDHERIDLDCLTKRDRKEFEKYCKLSPINLFKKLPNILFDE